MRPLGLWWALPFGFYCFRVFGVLLCACGRLCRWAFAFWAVAFLAFAFLDLALLLLGFGRCMFPFCLFDLVALFGRQASAWIFFVYL